MPLHTFECLKCKSQQEILITLSKLDEMKTSQRCECDGPMRMLVSVPNLVTDTDFMKGQNDNDGLPDERSRKIAHAKAKAAGVNIQGKKFHPGLCRRKNAFDPEAWYGDRAEAKAKTEALGRCAEGSVTHESSIRDEHIAAAEAPYKIAPEMVQPYADEIIQKQHGGTVSPAKRSEIYAGLIEKHSDGVDDPGPVDLSKG